MKRVILLLILFLIPFVVADAVWENAGTTKMTLDNFGNLNITGNTTSLYFFGNIGYDNRNTVTWAGVNAPTAVAHPRVFLAGGVS